MTRQDWADVALVVALGAVMLGSCAGLWAIQHGWCAPEPEPSAAVEAVSHGDR